MNIAHLAILAAALLPYPTVASAKATRTYDNAAPRNYLGRLDGWRARAYWAHQNHFEAFAPFAAGVLMAEWAHADQGRINALAIAFILLRLAYTLVYVLDLGTLRSAIFGGGLICVIWLMALSLS